VRPGGLDKFTVIGISAALVVWTSCLVMLWSWALDTSGLSLLLALAGTLLAATAAAPVPGRAARTVQSLLLRGKPQDVLRMELESVAPARSAQGEQRAIARLLCVSTLVAVAGGLASTAAIFAGAGLVSWLAERFLWDAPAWWGLQLGVVWIGMFPMGLGLSVAFLSGTVLRGSSGWDAYAGACRDWTWGLSAGLVLFGVCWWAGLNLASVSLAAACALLATAVGIYLRRRWTVRPRRPAPPTKAPARTLRWGVLLGIAVLALAILVQARLLQDLLGVHLAGRTIWAGASLALLSAFLRREDRKTRPPGRRQSAGAMLGLVSGLVMQSGLIVTSTAEGAVGIACRAFAAVAQVPLAALAAVMISRQRRLLAAAGGRARQYLSAAAGGAGLACLAYLAICWLHWAWVAILVLAAAGFAGAAVRNGRQSPSAITGSTVFQWATWSIVLMLSAITVAVSTLNELRRAVGRIVPGAWLTLVCGRQGAADPGPVDCLPPARSWRGEAITRTIADVMAGRPGRWLVAATCRDDAPAPESLPQVRYVQALPDAPWPAPGDGDVSACPDVEDLFAAARLGRETFEGVLLAPLPADHPEAWRCLNDQLLRRCASRSREGLLMVRTQTDAKHIGSALSAAKAFHFAAGRGWAVVEIGPNRVDILLVAGPPPTEKHLAGEVNALVVPLERLSPDWTNVRPFGLVVPPPAWSAGRPGLAEFLDWLRKQASQAPMSLPS
jgi:hypothetical protein